MEKLFKAVLAVVCVGFTGYMLVQLYVELDGKSRDDQHSKQVDQRFNESIIRSNIGPGMTREDAIRKLEDREIQEMKREKELEELREWKAENGKK